MFGCDLDGRASAETVALVTAAGGRMAALAPVDLAGADGAEAWVAAPGGPLAAARHEGGRAL